MATFSVRGIGSKHLGQLFLFGKSDQVLVDFIITFMATVSARGIGSKHLGQFVSLWKK